MSDFTKEIEILAQKSSREVDSGNALRYSQAALNLAHTEGVLFDKYKSEVVFKHKERLQGIVDSKK